METKRFRELLDQMHAGSDEAAWELVRLYGPHIGSIVRRRMGARLRRSHDTDDFVQAAWASLIRVMPRLKHVDEPRRFVAFLATIACRRLADEVRPTARGKPVSGCPKAKDCGSLPESQAGPVATPSQIAIAREQWHSLVDDLAPSHRQAIDLRLQGSTFAEIAEKTGLHERTARRVIQAAIRRRDGGEAKGSVS